MADKLFDTVGYPVIETADQALQDQGRTLPRQIMSPGAMPGKNDITYGGTSGVTISPTQGIFAGATTFASAPFSLDLSGNLKATSTTVQTGSSGKRIVIDSVLAQITVYDASNVVVGVMSATSGSAYFATSSALTAGGIALNTTTTALNAPDTGSVIIGATNGLAVNNITHTSTTSTFDKDVNITGALNVSGAKAFDIEHPTKPGKRLKYISVEGPEVLVICRGVCDTEDEIEYPDHFVGVSEPDSIQCMIGKERTTGRIAWVATAVRKGYADFDPEYTPAVDNNQPE